MARYSIPCLNDEDRVSYNSLLLTTHLNIGDMYKSKGYMPLIKDYNPSQEIQGVVKDGEFFVFLGFQHMLCENSHRPVVVMKVLNIRGEVGNIYLYLDKLKDLEPL